MKVLRKVLWGLGALLALALLAVAFVAYQQPGLLVDFTNLVFCG